MKRLLPVVLSVIVYGCDPIVEITNPIPEKVIYCDAPSQLLGKWTSDSVWIETRVDSLDTNLINTRPTYFYDMLVSCDEDTSLLLKYTNYSGVVTREVSSVNFQYNDSTLFAYDAYDVAQKPEHATFEMKIDFNSDSVLIAQYDQVLNADQSSTIHIWMRRSN